MQHANYNIPDQHSIDIHCLSPSHHELPLTEIVESRTYQVPPIPQRRSLSPNISNTSKKAANSYQSHMLGDQSQLNPLYRQSYTVPLVIKQFQKVQDPKTDAMASRETYLNNSNSQHIDSSQVQNYQQQIELGNPHQQEITRYSRVEPLNRSIVNINLNQQPNQYIYVSPIETNTSRVSLLPSSRVLKQNHPQNMHTFSTQQVEQQSYTNHQKPLSRSIYASNALKPQNILIDQYAVQNKVGGNQKVLLNRSMNISQQARPNSIVANSIPQQQQHFHPYSKQNLSRSLISSQHQIAAPHPNNPIPYQNIDQHIDHKINPQNDHLSIDYQPLQENHYNNLSTQLLNRQLSPSNPPRQQSIVAIDIPNQEYNTFSNNQKQPLNRSVYAVNQNQANNQVRQQSFVAIDMPNQQAYGFNHSSKQPLNRSVNSINQNPVNNEIRQSSIVAIDVPHQQQTLQNNSKQPLNRSVYSSKQNEDLNVYINSLEMQSQNNYSQHPKEMLNRSIRQSNNSIPENHQYIQPQPIYYQPPHIVHHQPAHILHEQPAHVIHKQPQSRTVPLEDHQFFNKYYDIADPQANHTRNLKASSQQQSISINDQHQFSQPIPNNNNLSNTQLSRNIKPSAIQPNSHSIEGQHQIFTQQPPSRQSRNLQASQVPLNMQNSRQPIAYEPEQQSFGRSKVGASKRQLRSIEYPAAQNKLQQSLAQTDLSEGWNANEKLFKLFKLGPKSNEKPNKNYKKRINTFVGQ